MNKNYDLINLENYKSELKDDLSSSVFGSIRANNSTRFVIESFINDIQIKREKLSKIIKDLNNSNQEGIIELKVETHLFKQLQSKLTDFKLDSIDKTIEYLIK